MYQRFALSVPRLQRFSRGLVVGTTPPRSTPDMQILSRAYEEFKKLELQRNATVLLCVSGGCDSIAMLHLMQNIRESHEPGLDLKVVNYNHKMREQSDTEAKFIENLAKQHNMEFFLRTLPESLRGDKFNQNAARSWRLEQSKLIAQSIEDNNYGSNVYIATAHHVEDQIENVLMRLVRGSHITNLQGMIPKSGCFLKPLLNLNKKDLQEFLQVRQLTWFEDSSNQERIYLRNKLRLDMIPMLSELAGGEEALKRRVLGLARQSSQAHNMVEQQALQIAQQLRTTTFRDYHALFFIQKANEVEFSDVDQSEIIQNESDANILSFGKLPPLVFQSILFDWILAKTGIELDQNHFARFHGFFQQDFKSGQYSIATTISTKWDLVRYHDEIRLVLRRNPSNVSKKEQEVKQQSNVGTIWTNTAFGIEGATLDQPPQIVAITHPDYVTVEVKAMVDNVEDYYGDNNSHTTSVDIDNSVELTQSATPIASSSSSNNAISKNLGESLVINHIRDQPWFSSIEFTIPMEKIEPKENVQEEEDVLDELQQTINFTVRMVEARDFFVHESFPSGAKVKNLINKLRKAKPELGFHNERALVVTALPPVRNIPSEKSSVATKLNDRNDDLHLLNEAQERIMAVILPDIVIYSTLYTKWLKHPQVVPTKIVLEVAVQPSPDVKV